jgi:hypothetical protein
LNILPAKERDFVSLKSDVSSLPNRPHLADFRLETPHFERARLSTAHIPSRVLKK